MENNPATQKPSATVKDVYEKLEELDKQQKLIDQDRNHLLATLEILKRDHKPKLEMRIPEPLLRKKEESSENADIDISDLLVNFERANNLPEKFFFLCSTAYDAGKLINNGKCAQYLIDHDQSKATYKNLTGNLGQIKRDWPNYFQEIKGTTHKYVPDGSYEPNTDVTEELPDDLPNSQDSSQ